MSKVGGQCALSRQLKRPITWASLILAGFNGFVACLAQNPDAFAPVTNSFLTVYAVAAQTDGKILFAGNGFGDDTLTRVNRDGSPDTNYHSLTFGEVSSLAIQPDGKILATGYKGGTWVERFNPDGTSDPNFKPQYNGNMGGMQSLVLQPDGKIIIGGNFFSYGQGIARLDVDGSIDTNFNASVLNGMYSCCAQALAIQPDGRIIVGGGFDHLDEEPRSNLGRINATGSLDHDFNPAVIGGGVLALVIQPDHKILVGGGFTQLAGQPRSNLGRLNEDGSPDLLFNPGVTGTVQCLALQTDGKILVGGTFTSAAGQACTNIVRLNPDGSLDPSFNTWVRSWENTGGTVYSMALQEDGKVLIAGSFTNLAGQLRLNLGRVSNTENSTQNLSIQNSRVTWVRAGPSPEIWRATFEASTNGTNWNFLGNGSWISNGWELLSVTIPPESVVRARGFVAAPPSSWFVETAPATLFAAGFRSGAFGFNIVGVPGQNLVVDGSTDSLNWIPLASNTLEASPLYFSDPDSPKLRARFYRVRSR